MESYESECRALILWLRDELAKIDDIPWEGGLDGEHTRQERMINAEYRKRRKALKEKYNVQSKSTTEAVLFSCPKSPMSTKAEVRPPPDA